MNEKPDELDSWQECLFGLVFWIEAGIAIAAVARAPAVGGWVDSVLGR
jgi:hypothetical protein